MIYLCEEEVRNERFNLRVNEKRVAQNMICEKPSSRHRCQNSCENVWLGE
jgi:hypothetical protein